MTAAAYPRIGFIGQGYIGKNYADNFERRGYTVVRYALEEPYRTNKDFIKNCDVVFIAVPTPTTPAGFDYSAVATAISLVKEKAIVVIKSTVLPGTTETLQKAYPSRTILFSPEFLTEATAADEAAHPKRNIIGIPLDDAVHRAAADAVLAILPNAPYAKVCRSKEAEYIKYGGNNWFYVKVLFINALYDLTQHDGCDYSVIKEAMAADQRIGPSHLMPLHASGTPGGNDFHAAASTISIKPGRGAGGHCFIKDFAAFAQHYRTTLPDDTRGIAMLDALEAKNIELLTKSGKDLDLLHGVYGDRV